MADRPPSIPPAARAFKRARDLLAEPVTPARPTYVGNSDLQSLANLAPETEVRFFLHGEVRNGRTVGERVINAQRRHGIGRVSYDVATLAGTVRVPATNIISHTTPKKAPRP